jgi:hypothetical protein
MGEARKEKRTRRGITSEPSRRNLPCCTLSCADCCSARRGRRAVDGTISGRLGSSLLDEVRASISLLGRANGRRSWGDCFGRRGWGSLWSMKGKGGRAGAGKKGGGHSGEMSSYRLEDWKGEAEERKKRLANLVVTRQSKDLKPYSAFPIQSWPFLRQTKKHTEQSGGRLTSGSPPHSPLDSTRLQYRS